MPGELGPSRKLLESPGGGSAPVRPRVATPGGPWPRCGSSPGILSGETGGCAGPGGLAAPAGGTSRPSRLATAFRVLRTPPGEPLPTPLSPHRACRAPARLHVGPSTPGPRLFSADLLVVPDASGGQCGAWPLLGPPSRTCPHPQDTGTCFRSGARHGHLRVPWQWLLLPLGPHCARRPRPANPSLLCPFVLLSFRRPLTWSSGASCPGTEGAFGG